MPPGRAPSLIACVLLSPWPLVQVQRQHPGVPVALLGDTRRVIQACPLAQGAGIHLGMREGAALSRCPDLHTTLVPAAEARAAWAEVLDQLYARYSDRVEGQTLGTAFLVLSAPAARDLAAALHAPVGLAASRELAHLAALRAVPGEVHEVSTSAEQAFLMLAPLAHLGALSVPPGAAERLQFLGVRDLGGLMDWSAAQRQQFLGVDVGKRLNRFLRGERTRSVERYHPGPLLTASLVFDAPLAEPAQAGAALRDLLPGLVVELRGRLAATLTVQAETIGGTLQATRPLKWPLDEAALVRVAGLALADARALPLGIDRLTVQLGGLATPGRMVGLWAGLAELEVTKTVLSRFPDALVRVRWLDPWAYTADQQYEWIDWHTGEVRVTALTPRLVWPAHPAQRRQQAVAQVLAFFDGVSP
ncbi:Y-family DNA polymerase [Deinococcus sp. HMF7620]|uniref:Y-family DNA polymerase n=1 Tax=Deinococcus arboris TaxID=2682977 RepID=A0A7C9LUS1_9DEIO|nr:MULTISPECIES: Y-family DNA polymerase [Deinococcus]MBZ9752168.1 Y-family DNA polymerase [Deinococcus betulae]MVN87480.1 Y-family DNA polymerase [Deinococcus arboris]